MPPFSCRTNERLYVAIAAIAILIPCAQAQPQYTVVDLGVMGGGATLIESHAFAINNAGQVVGFSYAGPNNQPLAFRTAPNSPINPLTDDLGTLGGGQANGYGINGSGQVAGWALTPDFNPHAFRTSPNSPINAVTSDLGTLYPGSRSQATGINTSGQVIGFAPVDLSYPVRFHAFRTAPNGAINPATDNLGTLGGSISFANGINDFGRVVGSSDLPGDVAYHAFRTAPNSAINFLTDDLGTFGGPYSLAVAINNSGQTAGCAHNAGGFQHAFRVPSDRGLNPSTDDLGTLGGDHSCGYGINSAGQVVGAASTLPNQSSYHAFVYIGGVMLDLNNRIPAGSGWVLTEARAINELGQIAGTGVHNGQTRAFRLDPVSGATPTGTSVTLAPSLTLQLFRTVPPPASASSLAPFRRAAALQ